MPMENIFSLTDNSPFNTTGEAAFAIILNWFSVGAILVVLLNSFFNIKNLKNLVVGFFFASIYIKYNFFEIKYCCHIFCNKLANYNFCRHTVCFNLSGYVGLWNNNCKKIYLKKKIDAKQIKLFLVSIVGILIVTMPSYLIQSIFGAANPSIEIIDFTLHHRLFIYAGFLLPFIIFFIFKKQKEGCNQGRIDIY